MIIVGSTLPWTAIQLHPVWTHVQWIPFTVATSVRRLALDIVINVGMYLPFGYLSVSVLPAHARLSTLLAITGMALVLSIGMELSQFFNPTGIRT
jgi:glycopeptide antibiotics resistance protein